MEIKKPERDPSGEKIGKTISEFLGHKLKRFKGTKRGKKDKEPE
jgi:hypothetical protein